MVDLSHPIWNPAGTGNEFNDEYYGRRLQLLMRSGAQYLNEDTGSSLVQLASSSMSDYDMLNVYHKAVGQRGILAIRDQFEAMPRLWQEGEFANLPVQTRNLLSATGYVLPKDQENRHLWDRIAHWDIPIIEDAFSNPITSILWPVRAVGYGIASGTKGVWDVVMKGYRAGTHAYRSADLMVARSNPRLFPNPTNPFFQAEMPTSANFLNPAKWLDAWNDTMLDEDTYSDFAISKGTDLVGPARLELMRLYMRDGLQGVAERFEEMGVDQGLSREKTASAFASWVESLSDPAEEEARQILEANRRSISASIVAHWNRTNVGIPDVRPGTAPAMVVGGVGALAVEIMMDPLTWGGTIWIKVIKASRAGIRVGTTPRDLHYWRNVTEFFRNVDATAAEWSRATFSGTDESLSTWVKEHGQNLLSKTYLNIRAHALAQNRFIDRLNQAFKTMDELDEAKILIRGEMTDGVRDYSDIVSIRDEAERRVREKLGKDFYPIDQLLRDRPALAVAIGYMKEWHLARRGHIGVRTTDEGFKVVDDIPRTHTEVTIDGDVYPIVDDVGDEVLWEYAIRRPMSDLTSPDGYWSFLADSREGWNTMGSAFAGFDKGAMYLPKIGSAGRVWIWGKKWFNKPIDFAQPITSEIKGTMAEWVGRHLGDKSRFLVDELKELIDESLPIVEIEGEMVAVGHVFSKEIDHDMLVRFLDEPTLSTAESLGLTADDFKEIERLRDNIVAGGEFRSAGEMDDLGAWHAKENTVLSDPKTGQAKPYRMPFSSARSAVRNYYGSRIHSPGSINDELTWLEKIQALPGASAIALAHYPFKFAAKLTNYTPRTRFLNVLDPDTAVREFTGLVEMGVMAHMPRAQIDKYIRTFVWGNEAERWAVQVEFFMDFLGRSGALMHGGKATDDFIQRFIRHADARYSLVSNDTMPFMGINIRRAIMPGVEHSAEFSALNVIPNYRELATLTRQMSIYQKMFGTGRWLPWLDNKIARVWRPAVLMRLGYVARNGGEELFSWWAREGISGYANQKVARAAMDSAVVWDEYGRKTLAKVSAIDRQSLIMRPFIRVHRAINELAGIGDFSVTLRGMERAMTQPENLNRWMFMTPDQRLEAFEWGRREVLKEIESTGIFARYSRNGLVAAEAFAERLGVLFHHVGKVLPEGWQTRRELAGRLGRRMDRNHDKRVKKIQQIMTQPTIRDEYMKHILGTFDTYTSFDSMNLDSVLRRGGFGMSTRSMLQVPMNYDRMGIQTVVNRAGGDTNLADKSIAVTQKLGMMADDPGHRTAIYELIHLVPPAQDAPGEPLAVAMATIVADDPRYRTPRYAGREAEAERTVPGDPGVVKDEVRFNVTSGSPEDRAVYDATVAEARARGDDVTETVRTSNQDIPARDVPMRERQQLSTIDEGTKVSDTRLASDFPGTGTPQVRDVVRFRDGQRSVLARVTHSTKIEKSRRVTAWVNPETGAVHPVQGREELAGRVPWLTRSEDIEGSTDITYLNPSHHGYELRTNYKLNVEDDIEFLRKHYEEEGFATYTAYGSHLRKLSERGQSGRAIRQIKFERIDNVEERIATIAEGGTSTAERVIAPLPEMAPMTPSEFMWRHLNEEYPEFRDRLEVLFDLLPEGRIKYGSGGTVQLDSSLEDAFEDALLILPEHIRGVWRELLYKTTTASNGEIIVTDKIQPSLIGFLLQRLNPSKLSSDEVEIAKRVLAAYRAGGATAVGQQMSMSAARAAMRYEGSAAISNFLPEGYTRIYIPLIPVEHRVALYRTLSGVETEAGTRASFVETFQRILGEKFDAMHLDYNPAAASHLLLPFYSPEGGTALDYYRLATEWADSGAAHFPVMTASTNPDVAKAIGETLDEIFGVATTHQRSIIGSLEVNSETIFNTPGAAVTERTANRDPLDITQSQGGLTTTVREAELANLGDPVLVDPFYGWTPNGSVSAHAFPGGEGVSKEHVFGISPVMLSPSVEGIKPIQYVNDLPQLVKMRLYKHTDGRHAQVMPGDERKIEWYENATGWALVDEQVLSNDNLINWINDSANRNVPEIYNLLTGDKDGALGVAHPWAREILRSSKERDVSLERVLMYADWDRAPKRLLATLPVTDEGGKFGENIARNWKTLIQNWFEGVVNPLIGAMVREPMFQHYLLLADEQTTGVRHLYHLSPQRTDDLMRTFSAGRLDEEGQFFIPGLESFVTIHWPGVTPDSPKFFRDLAFAIEQENPKALASLLDNALHPSLDDPAQIVQHLTTDETDAFRMILTAAESGDTTRITSFFKWAKNRKIRTEVHREVSLRRALTLTGAYIDDHRIRSQFQEMVGTAVPFWFAEDNFLRRLGRGVIQNPMMLRNLHLTMNAGVYSGLIQENEQGDKFLIYPGSDIATGFMLDLANTNPITRKIFGGDLGQVLMSPLASSINIIPGFEAERMGEPGFGPLLAVPIMWDASRDPSIRATFEKNLVGNRYGSENATSVVLGSVVPAIISRSASMIGINFPDPRARDKATVDVLRMLAISGDIPSQKEVLALDQPELFEEHFMHKVDQMAHQFQMLQALTWFAGFTTGTFSELVTHEGWEWQSEFQALLDFGVPFEEAYPLWMKRIEAETGRPFDPQEWSPFRASQTTKSTFAALEATAEANEWLVENREFVEVYGMASPFFMPRRVDSTDDEYSSEAKQRAVNYGLRKYRTPSEFLSELYYQTAYPEYHRQRTKYLRERYALKSSGMDITDRDRRWHAWLDSWSARNPVFASRIATANSEERRNQTIEEFRRLLAAPSVIPAGLHTEDLKQVMRVIIELDDLYTILKNVRTTAAQQRRDQARYISYRLLERFIRGRPWLNEMYYSVFLPLIGETWISKMEAGVVDIPQLGAA